MRKRDNKFEYFNIGEWKYMDFTEPVNDEDYYTKDDFVDRPNSDWFALLNLCGMEKKRREGGFDQLSWIVVVAWRSEGFMQWVKWTLIVINKAKIW